MSFSSSAPRIALTAIFFLGSALALLAQTKDDDIAVLREQIRVLDQKLRVLERKQELKDEDLVSAAKAAPKISVTDRGFILASADGANAIKLRGLVQLDHRAFFNDGGIVNNTFLLRRARLITEGTFAKNYFFQLVPEFGGSAAPSILDANLGVTISPALQLKFGKFKSPVGLELLQSDSWTFFNERSIVTNLVPNRDVGVQASGDLLSGSISYTVGVFGGEPDGGSTSNVDFDNDKDFVGRLIASPFKNSTNSPLQKLSVGVSGSYGREKTASGRSSGYRTDGQQTFFSYLASTISDGQSWRVSPQADYRNGPFGAIGEYVVSTVNVRAGATAPKTELQNKGWQLTGGYVLTGEDSSYSGVVPRTNFDYAAGTWGAFEVVGRVAHLKVDDAAFPAFASTSASANAATSFGLGLNWYLSKAVLVKMDYYQTRFDLKGAAAMAAVSPPLRQDEQAFITRLQVAF